jgi:hypothetical protein
MDLSLIVIQYRQFETSIPDILFDLGKLLLKRVGIDIGFLGFNTDKVNSIVSVFCYPIVSVIENGHVSQGSVVAASEAIEYGGTFGMTNGTRWFMILSAGMGLVGIRAFHHVVVFARTLVVTHTQKGKYFCKIFVIHDLWSFSWCSLWLTGNLDGLSLRHCY